MASKYICFKLLSIFSYQENANQNHIEIPSRPRCHEEIKTHQVPVRAAGKTLTLTQCDGDVNCCSHHGNLNRGSQKPKNRTST